MRLDHPKLFGSRQADRHSRSVPISHTIENDNVTLILGDNIFVDSGEIRKTIHEFKSGSTIFSYQVKNPCQFGVVNDKHGVPPKLVEKPSKPRVGLQFWAEYFRSESNLLASSLKPSFRGETEITDLNNIYLSRNELKVKAEPR